MRDFSKLSFIQKGTGKDMVFFHGYLSCKETFLAQIEYFSKFYRVTAFDFLGFGKSPALSEPFSVSDYAAWTADALEYLNVKNPHLIAHSFGVRVAVKMVAQRGQVFDKLLFTGPAGIVERRGLSYKIKVGAYRVCKRVFPRFAERKFGSKEYRSLSPLMKESYKKIVNEDLRVDAQNIKRPLLIALGRDDKVTPLSQANIYKQNVQGSVIRLLDGGHFCFLEHPTPFNLIAEEFFYD